MTTDPVADSFRLTLGVRVALRTQGLTDEETQSIIDSPDVARAMVLAGRKHLRLSQPQPMTLDTPVAALNFGPKVRSPKNHIMSALRFYGIRVVGDLAQLRELDLVNCPYIGTKTVQMLKDVAAEYDVSLFVAGDTPLEQAIEIAGSVDKVHARLMRLWQPGIDMFTQHFLREMTLKELSMMSRDAFIPNRRLAHHYLSRTTAGVDDAQQAAIVTQGLATAGLSFAGE